MSNKNCRKPRVAKKATINSPTAGDDPASASRVAEQLDPRIKAHRSGKSVAPTDHGGDITSGSRADVNATAAALMTEVVGVRSGDDTDDDQLVMPSGDQGAVFPAQREGASFGEHPSNILGPKLFGRGPSPGVSMLVDPRIPSVGAAGSRRPSMVASSKRLSSIDTNAEAGMFALNKLRKWSTDRWTKADQELATFTDNIAGALAQVTKVSVELQSKSARMRAEYHQLNRALQAKLDATEFVLSGQNNVSSIFSYATGSGSSYAVILSPMPSIESLPGGPVSRVPSKDGSVLPHSFLVDHTSGRVEGTAMVPETPFPGPDTTDVNIMASVLRLGDDRHLPNESALEYERRRAAAQRMARVQSTPFIERGRKVDEPVPRRNDDNSRLSGVPPGLPPRPDPHQFATGRRWLSGPPGLPTLPKNRGFARDGPPHQATTEDPVYTTRFNTIPSHDEGYKGGRENPTKDKGKGPKVPRYDYYRAEVLPVNIRKDDPLVEMLREPRRTAPTDLFGPKRPSGVPPAIPPDRRSPPIASRGGDDGVRGGEPPAPTRPPSSRDQRSPPIASGSGGNSGRGGAPPAPPPSPGSSNSSAASSHRCFNSGDCDGRRPLPSNQGSNDGWEEVLLVDVGPDLQEEAEGLPVEENNDNDSSNNDDQPHEEQPYGPSNVRFDLGIDLMSSGSRRPRPDRMSHAYSGAPQTYLNPTAIVDHPNGYEEESLTQIRSSQPLPKGVKTPASYHWEGEDDVEKFKNWFQFLLRWMSMQGLTGDQYDRTRVDFLGQFLRKQALSWFNHEIDTPTYYDRDLNFEKVVCALHTRFLHKATTQEAVHKFLNCKFSSETGVAAYCNALRHNAGRMVVAPDDYTFRREFLAGIPEEIRDLLMKNRGVNAKFTPSEVMYREAIEMETSLRFMARQRQLSGARQSEGKSSSKTIAGTDPLMIEGTNEIIHLEENTVIVTRETEMTNLPLTTSLKVTARLDRTTIDVRESITNGMTDHRVTTDMANASTDVTCHNCGKKGHMQRQCPSPQRDAQLRAANVEEPSTEPTATGDSGPSTEQLLSMNAGHARRSQRRGEQSDSGQSRSSR
ncbi:hypothetical protein JAAARDRAFT_190604 [Jaapia argillacea MUCL 33604]|uniref:CCHC-type domain-containing protein n=1 Tax=Jaapia argillacea MUCL 33604 TaxID=933084 RepID=A0A067QEF5_9AGAM|nr:hypothetical protein JAAARDRAFT_190604 [Jaapia argillacea MUCL 33604]